MPEVKVEVTPIQSLDKQPVVVPESISHLDMLDLQNGWMITDHNVLRTQDGGTTWHNVTPPNASALGFGTGFSFLDSNRGWILVPDQNDPLNHGSLYRTVDGGLNWLSFNVPLGSGNLKFLDDNNGWLMLIAGAGAGSMPVKFFQTHDGGLNWTQVFTDVPTDPNPNNTLPASGIKSGFTPVSMQEAWVSGQEYAPNIFYLFHTLDGGQTWSKVDYQMPFTGEATYLTQPPIFFDSQNGILPMTAGRDGQATLFLKTMDGGATWTASMPVTGAGQYFVVSLHDLFVWFAGELSVSHDGGQTWTNITPNLGWDFSTFQFQFVDLQTGWAVTSASDGHTSLYKTIDGGQTWNALVQ
jgi:photosystem II stability/assembly factor-like uncharacterized protein